MVYIPPKRCMHNVEKYYCKQCGGKGLCIHQKRKINCTICCKTARRCVHNRWRYRCKDCNGSKICVHQKYIYRCRDCKGSSICIHQKEKYLCKECGGASLCKHGLQLCKECLPLEKRISSGLFCILCTDIQLSSNRRRANIKTCASCDPTVPDRIELIVRPLLISAIGVEATIADNAMLGGAGCDALLRRPDLMFVRSDEMINGKPSVNIRVVCLEIDENGGHPDRESICESGKMWDQTVAIKRLLGEETRVVFVRFNPDRCDTGHFELERRVAAVGAFVRTALEDSDPNDYRVEVPNVAYLFYHSICSRHIEYVRIHSESFHVLYVGPENENTVNDEN